MTDKYAGVKQRQEKKTPHQQKEMVEMFLDWEIDDERWAERIDGGREEERRDGGIKTHQVETGSKRTTKTGEWTRWREESGAECGRLEGDWILLMAAF